MLGLVTYGRLSTRVQTRMLLGISDELLGLMLKRSIPITRHDEMSCNMLTFRHDKIVAYSVRQKQTKMEWHGGRLPSRRCLGFSTRRFASCQASRDDRPAGSCVQSPHHLGSNSSMQGRSLSYGLLVALTWNMFKVQVAA